MRRLWLAVCSVCARCVLVCRRALGRVVAGRFWCSYAWVSLTQTAPARPRGCLCACVQACVRACSPVHVCARGCVRSYRRCVPLCRRCGGVWCVAGWVGLWPLTSFALCACACLFSFCISLCISFCVRTVLSLSASLYLSLGGVAVCAVVV